jgi:hypothetical protein
MHASMVYSACMVADLQNGGRWTAQWAFGTHGSTFLAARSLPMPGSMTRDAGGIAPK